MKRRPMATRNKAPNPLWHAGYEILTGLAFVGVLVAGFTLAVLITEGVPL